jgi:hypothetical protein
LAQDALDLEEGQEEAWVIRAIGAKLLEARIDQMRRSVSVTKLTQRTFTAAAWADLRAQLAAWKVRGSCRLCALLLAAFLAECGDWCNGAQLHLMGTSFRLGMRADQATASQCMKVSGGGPACRLDQSFSAMLQENVWSVKDLVGSHKEDGLSRGVPTAPVALRA